jgi:hypothetical protein
MYVDPTGHDKAKNNKIPVDLTNGMQMYDPNSLIAQYISVVKNITNTLTKPLIDNAFRKPTTGNLYPPMQFKPFIVQQMYEELGHAMNNKKNEPVIKVGLRIVKEFEDLYTSFQEGVSVAGPNPLGVSITTFASFIYKHNPDNIEPGYLQDYLYDVWSNKNKKSLIINMSKALFIENTEFKYLIKSKGARDIFIKRLNNIKDSVDDFDLNGFDETTQENIKYLAKNHIDRIIEMNNNYSSSLKYLNNKLRRIEQDIKEKLR